MKSTLLLDQHHVQRTLTRLAYEIAERNKGLANVVVVGVLRRGAVVAEKVATEMEKIESSPISVQHLDPTPYRDDLPLEKEVSDMSRIDIDITDKDVVLVDDVLFTGRTIRAALDGLIRFGRPRSIQLAVLIDRGHREFPIRPDYTGRIVQTKHSERVAVRPEEGLAIYIEE